MTPAVWVGVGVAALALLLRGFPLAVRLALGAALLGTVGWAIPALGRQARDRAEAPVIQDLYLIALKQRELRDARVLDADEDGRGEYGSLWDMYRTRPPLVNDLLGTGQEFGYLYTVVLGPTADDRETRFHAYAVPSSFGVTGRRAAFVDETGVVRIGDPGPVSFVSREQGRSWPATPVPGLD